MAQSFLRLSVAVILLAGAAALHASAPAASAHKTDAPAGRDAGADAISRLEAGNARFVASRAINPHQDSLRRVEVAAGQKPFAIILTCADSRVAPEILFDQGLGDLFVLRNAGNVVDDHVLGSIEYAVEHLGAPLIVVVGHSKCGAVGATVEGGHAPGHIGAIVRSIEPALKGAEGADKVDAVVRAHALLTAKAIAGSGPILSKAVEEGHVRVLAARYDITTGRVEFLKSKAPSH